VFIFKGEKNVKTKKNRALFVASFYVQRWSVGLAPGHQAYDPNDPPNHRKLLKWKESLCVNDQKTSLHSTGRLCVLHM
jgi:hypothetical protein